MKYLRRKVAVIFGLAAVLAAGFAFSAALSRGSGSAQTVAATTIGAVTCNLPVFNPTHFALKLGETVTCTISDPDLVVNGPVDVNIQSTDFGNTTVGGTGNTATHTITFTYKAVQNGCNTSAITYDKVADDGGGGVVSTGAGFAYVDANGDLIVCGQTTTTGTTTTGTTTTGTTTTVTTPGTTTTVTTPGTTTPGGTTTAPGATTTVAGATTTAPAQTTTVTQTVTTGVKGVSASKTRPKTVSHKKPTATG